jgi:tetratricopeptide (TPR) repeat protein
MARHYAETARHLEAERSIAQAERFARGQGSRFEVQMLVLAEKVDVLRELGRLEEASQALDDAFERLLDGPSSPSLLRELQWRESVLSLAEGDAALAEAELTVCLEEGGDRLGPLSHCRAQHFLGLAKLALHRFHEVARCFDRAAALYFQPYEDLRSAERWWALLRLAARTGRVEEMERAFRSALEHLSKAGRSDLAVLLCVELSSFYGQVERAECADQAGWLARWLGGDFGWLGLLDRGELRSQLVACGSNLLRLERVLLRMEDPSPRN